MKYTAYANQASKGTVNVRFMPKEMLTRLAQSGNPAVKQAALIEQERRYRAFAKANGLGESIYHQKV